MTRALVATALMMLSAPAWGAPAWGQVQTPARPASSDPVIRISGSSTVYPIVQLAIAADQKRGRNPQARFDLKEAGTSAGLRQFCSGQLTIANASRPISRKELDLCARNGVRFVELPIAFDALTVVVHPANTWARQISSGELARLWGRQAQGRVNRWVDVNRDWPDRPIKLCGPGKDSGTYDYFNKAINGSADNSRSDYTASEDDTVIVRCVAENPNALGYFGYSYFKNNAQRLRALAILGDAGAVSPSPLNVQTGRYRPLSRPLFLYVNDQAMIRSPELQKFITFTIRNGLRIVAKAGDIPLPASTYRLVESKLYKRVLGSAFAGDLPVGLSIGEALRRSFDLNKLPQFR